MRYRTPASIRRCDLVAWITLFVASTAARAEWPATGSYEFRSWAGPPLGDYYSIPPRTGADSPILVIMPGAQRNAEQYRDEWDQLATANHFITLVVEASKEFYPTEYDYNLGGAVSRVGIARPEQQWLFSAIDPLFDDFKNQFHSNRTTYDLYGHSAGGGFVHCFSLFKPDAKVSRAVTANPAFVTMPSAEVEFPFGLKGAPLPADALRKWFSRRLVLLLGDRDLDHRTMPLSSGGDALLQGPNVFARGLGFFQAAVSVATEQALPLRWQLEIVRGVGHSNAHMAPHAVKYFNYE